MTIDRAREIVEAVAQQGRPPIQVASIGRVSDEEVIQAFAVCMRACMSDVSDEQLQAHYQRMVAKVGHEGAVR